MGEIEKKFWRTQIECRWNNKEVGVAGFGVAGEPYCLDFPVLHSDIPTNILPLLEIGKILHAEYDYDGHFRNWEET